MPQLDFNFLWYINICLTIFIFLVIILISSFISLIIFFFLHIKLKINCDLFNVIKLFEKINLYNWKFFMLNHYKIQKVLVRQYINFLLFNTYNKVINETKFLLNYF